MLLFDERKISKSHNGVAKVKAAQDQWINAMDFSKAFDTVRHVTLMEKIAMLDLPDHVYNWLVNFFTGRLQCITYGGDTSALATISASIVQGSAIGPASYVVNASDLKSVSMGNVLLKYADDTYAMIPSVNVETRTSELDNVEPWAQKNNLKLNRSKCVKIIFNDRMRKRQPVMPANPAKHSSSTITEGSWCDHFKLPVSG